jgi:formylglycine-generating enzyme required for sulfatase activity
MKTSSPSQSPRREDLTERRIQVFEQRFGSAALDFACHAAFPLTLTTDLLYCLRESFEDLKERCPWYVAADVLLSGLCDGIGYDLYEMEGRTRIRLLHRLVEGYGEGRLNDLEAFMCAYISHRLEVEKSDRSRIFGDRPHWTALACLRPTEAVESIKQELRRLVAQGEDKERLRLAAMVERYADLLDDPLSRLNFRPLLLDWAESAERGGEIKDGARASTLATQLGVTLKPLAFDMATVGFDDEVAADELQPFSFETVTVNKRGKVIRTERGQAYYFAEPLGFARGKPLGKGIPPLEMVAISSGKFVMGSPLDEPERYDESPQHEVTVPPFFMGRYLVTQAQWRAVAALPQINRKLKPSPSRFKGDNRPVERVSWYDAVEFCDRLARETGRPYRLPTEAEWEYACRAGTKTPFHFGETITTDLANYNGNYTYGGAPKGKYPGKTTPVDHFQIANAYGLSDMHGNVDEWCLDHWHENYEGAPTDGSAWLSDQENDFRVIRSGSWHYDPRFCRCAYRHWNNPDDMFGSFGFRVVCAAPRALQ